ncbi:MAG: hypothetical protein WCL53_04875 [Chloroflexota bacterium]
MRLPSPFARLTHRAAATVATEVAAAVRSTAEATLAEVVEAVRAEVTAPLSQTISRKTSHRGRTAVTIAAVTATAVVATAAYVWWKRRDHVQPEIAEIEYPNETPAPPRTAPVATATPVVAAVSPVVEVAHAYAEPVAPAPVVEPIAPAPVVEPKSMAIDDCGAHSEGPRPSVAAANPSVVRPPATAGRPPPRAADRLARSAVVVRLAIARA